MRNGFPRMSYEVEISMHLASHDRPIVGTNRGEAEKGRLGYLVGTNWGRGRTKNTEAEMESNLDATKTHTPQDHHNDNPHSI